MMKGVWLGGAMLVALGAVAEGEILDPPGKSLDAFTMNNNDGYEFGRGVLFTADADFTITDVGWYNDMPVGSEVTFRIYKVLLTKGVILNGQETLLATATMTTTETGLAAHVTTVDPTALVAGKHYLLQVTHDEYALWNYFYRYDPVEWGDPPFTVGNVTVLDGTANGNTGNTVMARMQFNELGGCPADINGDGELNVLDFVAFQNAWQTQDPIGDCDCNGIFNIIDFVCFQDLFLAGCD